MKLLAYIVVIQLTLSACGNASSAVSLSEDIFTTDGSIDSNGSQNNNDTDDECGVYVCELKVRTTCDSEGQYVWVIREEDVAEQILNIIIYVGFSISLIACIVANVIYAMTRRGLKGTPYHVHWNLVASFTIYHVVFLIVYSILPTCHVTNVHVRNFLNVLLGYTVLANFFWMLVEGLILFGIVVISFFKDQRGREFIKWCVLGWGGPAVLIIIWIIVKRLTLTGNCSVFELRVGDPGLPNILCLIVPVLAILLINGVVLVIVMININRKLRACDRRDERKRHGRTAKSTLVLLVLLGCYYALPILAALIQDPCLMVYIVSYISIIISSLQGLAVTTLYVFRNAEVREQVRRLLSRRFDQLDVSWTSGTRSTRVSSRSSSKRDSSSSGSDGSKARRSTGGTVQLGVAMEMAVTKQQPSPDVNSNKPDREDDRILIEPRDVQEGAKRTTSRSGYTKLDTTDLEEQRYG